MTAQSGTTVEHFTLAATNVTSLTTTSDGRGGVFVYADPFDKSSTIVVNNEAQLNEAIKAVDRETNAGQYTIQMAQTITLGGDTDDGLPAGLYAVNLASGVDLTLDGKNNILSGGGGERGLFVYAGAVTIENLTIEDAKAIGGRRARLRRRRRGSWRRLVCREQCRRRPRRRDTQECELFR